jgi:hypothetical protein
MRGDGGVAGGEGVVGRGGGEKELINYYNFPYVVFYIWE